MLKIAVVNGPREDAVQEGNTLAPWLLLLFPLPSSLSLCSNCSATAVDETPPLANPISHLASYMFSLLKCQRLACRRPTGILADDQRGPGANRYRRNRPSGIRKTALTGRDSTRFDATELPLPFS